MNEQFDPYLQLVGALRRKEQATLSSRDTIKREIEAIANWLVTREIASHDQKLDAAFAYYVAGYYARAYNLAPITDLPHSVPLAQRGLCLFLAKQFGRLMSEVQAILGDKNYSDDGIRAGIESGELVRQTAQGKTVESEIIDRILSRSVAECFYGFLLFVETGDKHQLDRIYDRLAQCRHLAIKTRDSQWWWWLVCMHFVMREFVENSLWTQLQSMRLESEIVTRYIQANYKRKNPVVELWRSQIESLSSVNDPERRSFCLKMPTGAGKTRVAELMILRFLLDYGDAPNVKCVYIAPFRTLASEIEETLSSSFSLIPNAKVSKFYGGYEADLLDQPDVEQSCVLIVTPEKLDGMLRQNPKLVSQIRLIIVDEGHLIGDATERGRKYQTLLQRLIYALKIKREKSERQSTRLLFISGVLPDVQNFADWLTGDRNNIVETSWRPTDEPCLPGVLRWDGKEFIRSDTGQSICLPPIASHSQQKFGNDQSGPDCSFVQAIARVAVAFAGLAPTLLFSASKRHIKSEPLLAAIEDLVQQGRLGIYSLSSHYQRDPRYQRYYDLLERGVAVHHGDLPMSVRKQIEEQIYKEKARLVLASPTLAQGVNLPIHDVLVFGLEHAPGVRISDATFWNVVGRIGRPLPMALADRQLTRPEIWFLLDKSASLQTSDERIRAELLQSQNKFRIANGFFDFLRRVREVWASTRGKAPIESLVLVLAENDLTWIADDHERGEVQTLLDMIDAHLNDLSREARLSQKPTEDCLQEVTAELIRILQGVDELSDADLDYIREAIKARARFLSKIPEKQRERDYLLGLPKQDRSVIEKHQDELLEWYGLTSDIFAGRLDSGLEYLAKLMDFIAQLSIVNDKTTLDDISPSDAQPALFDISEISGQEVVRQNIFKAWVRGDDRMEVARHLQAVALNINFDFYVEHILEVNLPWGMSAIGRFLSNLSQERGLPLLRNLEYLPSLIKYGVPSEMACHLVRRGFSRPAAKKISDLYVRIARSQDVLGVTFEPEDLLWTGDVVIQVLRGLSDSDTAALELKGEDHRTLSEIRRQNML